jgi:hypothetical protein
MFSVLEQEMLVDCIHRYLHVIQEDPAFTAEVKQRLKRHYFQNFTSRAQDIIATHTIDGTPIRPTVLLTRFCSGFRVGFGTLFGCAKTAGHHGPCDLSRKRPIRGAAVL